MSGEYSEKSCCDDNGYMFKAVGLCEKEAGGVNELVCGDPDTGRVTYPSFRESECPAHCEAELLETTEFDGTTNWGAIQ